MYGPSLGLMRGQLIHVLSLTLLIAAHSVLLFFDVDVIPMIWHFTAERKGGLCLMARRRRIQDVMRSLLERSEACSRCEYVVSQ
jgi:hypothetical protein